MTHWALTEATEVELCDFAVLNIVTVVLGCFAILCGSCFMSDGFAHGRKKHSVGLIETYLTIDW